MTRMNSRERFITTINRGIADRVPIVTNFTVQLAERVAKKLGTEVEFIDSPLATRISHRTMLLKLGNDAVLVSATRGKQTITHNDGTVEDEWGLKYKTVGLYSEAYIRPLSECQSTADLEKYDFPKADVKERWTFAKETVAQYKNDYGIIGDLEACIFELAWNLVGLEKFVMDLYTGEQYIEALLDKITDYSIECASIMADMGVDVIWTGDDMGTQNGMMISPELWRQYFKPRLQKIFVAIKKKNPNVKIAYHSCGCIVPIICDLVEIGLDILNPLQPLATGMELSSLYKKYKDKLIFFGGVDVQEVLPNGSAEDVVNEVRRCIEATEGGRHYIIAPAHNMQPDTPIENVFAFFEAVKKYGEIK